VASLGDDDLSTHVGAIERERVLARRQLRDSPIHAIGQGKSSLDRACAEQACGKTERGGDTIPFHLVSPFQRLSDDKRLGGGKQSTRCGHWELRSSTAFEVVADGIYFIAPAGKDGRGREIRFYDFAKRQSRPIQMLGEVNTYVCLAVSPDRKNFFFSVRENNGRDLTLVDNFR
jgi:hypothetical protein